MSKFKGPLILLFTTLFWFNANAQLPVTGVVVDEKEQPVPGATVFLTNTKYMTVTNAKGMFHLDDLPAGTYQMAVKMMGYAPMITSLVLNARPVNMRVRLKENIKELKAVDIKDKADPSRAKYLDIFKKRFIGESVNAASCKILNPEVISFQYDKESRVLTASSETMLQIENSGLGYKVNYLLTGFEADLKNKTFRYSGYPYFEEMKGSPSQQISWNAHRMSAYIGSTRHFFRAVANGIAELDGFSIFTMGQIKDGNKLVKAMIGFPTDSIFNSLGVGTKMLKNKYEISLENDTTALYVMYKGGDAPIRDHLSFYVKLPVKYSSSSDQLSKMEPIAKNVVIDKNGELLPANSFIMSGFWADQRIAELTPLDFVVEFKHDAITQRNYEKKITMPDTSHDKEDHMRTQVLMLQNEATRDIKHP